MNSIRTSFTTIALFVLLIFSCIAYVANAQATTTPTPQERFENLQAERQPNRAAQAETQISEQSERRAALSERQQERFTNLAANMSNRMEAAIDRLANITQRLQSRSNLMADQGFDTNEADAAIETATATLEKARTTLGSIDDDVSSFVGSDNPRTAWVTLRETYHTARNQIIAARGALQTALRALLAAAATNDERGASEAVRSSTSTEAI